MVEGAKKQNNISYTLEIVLSITTPYAQNRHVESAIYIYNILLDKYSGHDVHYVQANIITYRYKIIIS